MDEKKEILSHYDKEVDEGFILESEGEKKSNLDSIRNKLNLLKKENNEKKPIELKFKKNFATDYANENEIKPKKFKKPEIKKNKRTLIEDEELNIVAGSGNAPLRVNLAGNDKIKGKFNSKTDEHDELEKFLSRQRDEVNRNKSRLPEEKIIELIDRAENEKESNDGQEIESSYSQNSKRIAMNETNEFLKKIPSKKEIEQKFGSTTTLDGNKYYNFINLRTPALISLKETTSGTASIVNIALPSERLKSGIYSVRPNDSILLGRKINRSEDETDNINDKSKDETSNNSNTTDKPIEKDDLTVLGLGEQPLGKGIALALQEFKRRKMIGVEIRYGRAKDERTLADKILREQDKKNKIDLEYRDAKGRPMSKQEAYRYLCYQFTNRLPGKKKTEKRILKEEKEEKMRSLDPSEYSRTLKLLRKHQEKTDSPFLVLEGKNNLFS